MAATVENAARKAKNAAIGEVKDKFSKATSTVFVNYKGMTVESATKLRASFRKAGSSSIAAQKLSQNFCSRAPTARNCPSAVS